MSESLIKADTALESLRSSDFDTYSAYGEVIDNSIQANATNIWIYLNERTDRTQTKKSQIGQAIFVDNGDGMSHVDLHKCLKLGHSSRYNDRSGIGRFGVGMTLGAIHEARRIEVYSKKEKSNWQWTYIDLDEIAGKDDASIPKPVNKKPKLDGSIDLDSLSSGTVLIWSKYDKAIDDYATIIEESKFYIGRTFRMFIQGRAQDYKKVKIKLNDEKVFAWDPLFHFQDEIKYSNPNEQSSLTPPQKLKFPVGAASVESNSSEVIINISNFSDTLRQKRGEGKSSFAKARYIDRNEGISILRNDREVFFGHVPHSKFYKSSEAERNKTRYVGIEIAFRAELDEEFSVKNIKRGAVPVRHMKEKLVEKMHPSIAQSLRELTQHWDLLEEEIERQTEAMATKGLPKTADVDTMIKVASLKDKGALDLDNSQGLNRPDNSRIAGMLGETDVEALQEALELFGIVVDKRQWPGNVFFDVIHGNGAKLLAYNTNSLVYKSFNSALRNVKSQDEELATNTKVIFDLIFVAMAMAEGAYDGSKETTWEKAMKNFRTKWSDNLEEIFSNLD
jgi:hypothetical protein